MEQAVRIHQAGAPEVLQLEAQELAAPGPGEVRIRHEAVGVNFADTYFRSGLYPVPLPFGIGNEAAGVIEALGAGVGGFAIGDRVSYTGFVNTLGAYSTARNLATSPLIRLPAGISTETAAASTMRGLTASYLLRRLHPFAGNETILLHAAAGGLGLILSQWAKLLGLRVIGTVSSAAKAEVALTHGCDAVIDYSREDVAARVRELTGGEGVAVVFDGVGAATFQASLDSLRRRGLLVCVGTASGLIPPFDPQILARKGSLFLTRPALADYIADPAERDALAGEFFGHVAAGRIRIEIGQRYRLSEVAQAHRDLEARRTVGSSIIVIPPVPKD
ncbi:MAG TPA: quinone oxidoreductase [Rhodocyclaceae bacterium]|nr:quinone oxidoreductase [Rhodocyclaceae bacterium]